ncbi:inosine/xanthosine triphosphatase [Ningiella sp. W23]|uniref:inosine/xanthosine triphosphatase n=1 Tax=Ningiella sp. W23 TaxID=3023715 RepID=UPI00375742FC
MKIVVASKNPVKINAAQSAFSEVFAQNETDIIPISVASNVPDQPMTYDETREGAFNRVQNAIELYGSQFEGDYYIAYEGGVEVFEDGPKTFAIVCISDGEQCIYGQTATLSLPLQIYQALLEGQELGDAMDALFNTHNIKQKGGAIGQLTSGLETRMSIYKSATILALSVFAKPALFISR